MFFVFKVEVSCYSSCNKYVSIEIKEEKYILDYGLCCVQIDYILGKNPKNMSYVVGFGSKFPRQVHHRGASIPNDHKAYSCTAGWKWRDNPHVNPNNITGAMVGGPDQLDRFEDVRNWYNNTEPTMVGNAGLVAALASLITIGSNGIDKNTIFQALPPLGPQSPAPPALWRP